MSTKKAKKSTRSTPHRAYITNTHRSRRYAVVKPHSTVVASMRKRTCCSVITTPALKCDQRVKMRNTALRLVDTAVPPRRREPWPHHFHVVSLLRLTTSPLPPLPNLPLLWLDSTSAQVAPSNVPGEICAVVSILCASKAIPRSWECAQKVFKTASRRPSGVSPTRATAAASSTSLQSLATSASATPSEPGTPKLLMRDRLSCASLSKMGRNLAMGRTPGSSTLAAFFCHGGNRCDGPPLW